MKNYSPRLFTVVFFVFSMQDKHIKYKSKYNPKINHSYVGIAYYKAFLLLSVRNMKSNVAGLKETFKSTSDLSFAGASLRVKTSTQGHLTGKFPPEHWLNFGMLSEGSNAEGSQGSKAEVSAFISDSLDWLCRFSATLCSLHLCRHVQTTQHCSLFKDTH